MAVSVLKVPAVEAIQGNRRLYTFAVDGKLLPRIASVSRVRRGANDSLEGYQRPEVMSHVASIRKYLESDGAMLPNAIVIAFDSSVIFEVGVGIEPSDYSRAGVLMIPLVSEGSLDWPAGWIVDGQQRSAAIRSARLDQFPICVSAFITADANEQRSQFILVNSSRPLAKSLIYELLPVTDVRLSDHLERRKLPARLLERLNLERDSPFRGKIRTPTSPNGTVKDNSVLRMVENSISDGALGQFCDDRGPSTELMVRLLKDFWTAVAVVFPEAWNLPPRRSRLMHGAGIVSMGFVMDAIADRAKTEPAEYSDFESDLRELAPMCHWTSGEWDIGGGMARAWDDIQNTSKDVQLLANHLLIKYRTVVLTRSAGL